MNSISRLSFLLTDARVFEMGQPFSDRPLLTQESLQGIAVLVVDVAGGVRRRGGVVVALRDLRNRENWVELIPAAALVVVPGIADVAAPQGDVVANRDRVAAGVCDH